LDYTYEPGSLILTINFGYPTINGDYLQVDGANTREIIQGVELPSLAVPLINVSEQAAVQVIAHDPIPSMYIPTGDFPVRPSPNPHLTAGER